jgi:hypothetical protein
MSTTETKSANRGFLKKMAAAGRLWIKCSYHYTDDYAYDNAVNCGRSKDFKQAYLTPDHVSPYAEEIDRIYTEARAAGESAQITHTRVEPLMERQRQHYRTFRAEQEKLMTGKVELYASDFRSKSGSMRGDKQSGQFSVHSNLLYYYEIR